MARNSLFTIIAGPLSLLALINAQEYSNTTFRIFQNATTATTSAPQIPSTVLVTQTPKQATVNSTTVIYQYSNATTSSRAAPTTPNVITSAVSQASTTTNPKVQNAAITTTADLACLILTASLFAVGAILSF